jgi:hypothetical protein
MSNEIPGKVYRGPSFPISLGLAFLERQVGKSSAPSVRGRLTNPVSNQGQGRLRSCLLEDEALLVHDRSQNGRAVSLWNPRRTANEASAAG